MAYVDLNPIRAGMEANLVESNFTSVQQRLFEFSKRKSAKTLSEARVEKRVLQQRDIKKSLGLDKQPAAPLMPFDGSSHTDIYTALPFTREDYFDLVDKTGRIIREDKRGFIPAELPSIIVEFDINPDKRIEHVKHFGRRYASCAGSRDNIVNFAALFDRVCGKGKGLAAEAYAKKRWEGGNRSRVGS